MKTSLLSCERKCATVAFRRSVIVLTVSKKHLGIRGVYFVVSSEFCDRPGNILAFNKTFQGIGRRQVRIGAFLIFFTIVSLFFSTLGYAQFVAFPRLNNGRILDSSSRFQPVEITQSNNSVSRIISHSSSAREFVDNPEVASNYINEGSEARKSNVSRTDSRNFSNSTQQSKVVSSRKPLTDSRTVNVNSSASVSQGSVRNIAVPRNNQASLKEETKKSVSSLKRINNQYDFLRIVSANELSKIKTSNDCVVVAVPRKNFLNAPKSSLEQETFIESEPNTDLRQELTDERSSIVSSIEKSDDRRQSLLTGPFNKTVALQNTDEYVIFILTNIDQDEQNLLRDSRNGRWEFADLLGASLIAEGLTTRESRAHYRARFETLLAALKRQLVDLNDPLMKTQLVYDFLHSTALYSKYDLNCSSVAASLDSGVFNCVSATVLFNCFASKVGLNVAALETTGHAKSRVKFSDCFLDIETTCYSWDRLPDRIRPYANKRSEQAGRSGLVDAEENLANKIDGVNTEVDSIDNLSTQKKNELDLAGNRTELVRESTGKVTFKPVVFDEDPVILQTVSSSSSSDVAENRAQSLNEHSEVGEAEGGFTTFGIDEEAPLGYSFTRNRRPMREISDVELVATIYYNIGVDRYQSGDYDGAIASYIKAVQLSPNNQTMLGNLKATLNNWAIDIATKEKDYATAIRITELGLKLDPDFHEYKMNLPIFFRDWIEYLGKDNKWEEVKRVQEEYWKRFPK